MLDGGATEEALEEKAPRGQQQAKNNRRTGAGTVQARTQEKFSAF